jgi:hypothetical protein
MLDPAVKVISTKTVLGFDPDTLLPSRNIQVTYKVGTQGPFILVTPADRFNEQYLEQETGKVVTTLRNSGILG